MKKHVMIGILLDAEKRCLVEHRAQYAETGGAWGFPGGKVEAGEEPLAALKRELLEELDVSVDRATPWMQLEYAYPHQTVFLDVWLVDNFVGEARGAEGQLVRWVALSELAHYKFPQANQKILEKLILQFA